MKCRLSIVVLALATAAAPALASRHVRQEYLDLAKAAYQAGLESCPASVRQWEEDPNWVEMWGYTPPGAPVWFARLAATLYDLTHEEDYAREAARWLAAHHRFKDMYPEELRRKRPEYSEGLPTVPDFFQLPYYCQAYAYIKASSVLTPEQRRQIEQSIAESADAVRHFPEWGPMNRAMLRAEALILAAQVLPDHPHAPMWRKMSQVLVSDSWGHWTEEDAQVYHPVWLGSLIRYADLVPDRSWYSQLTVRYYFEYLMQLLSPAGTVPDFGDGRWDENWAGYLACFERGATEYRRADLKWAAARMLEAGLARQNGPLSTPQGVMLADAYRWADDGVHPQEPPAHSVEVLEDLVGKKIVFRNGWQDDATYLLLNYRDEGDYARMPRDFLRHTIPVEEEKAHHGHSDENSICLLMNRGAVLLHDAGYREAIPSGPYGAFRADYFHNRLVVRREKRDRRQPLLEFLRNSGAYRPVRTDKIDFFTSEEVDVSRTRLTSEPDGYAAERVIVYLKPLEAFIVADIVKVRETDYYTFATLWSGTAVLEQDPQHYVTAVDAIQNYEPAQNRALLIDFLQAGTRQTGTFPLRRHAQEETTVFQTIASHYNAGQVETFATVLVPHERGSDVSGLLKSIRLLEVEGPRDGIGIAWDADGQSRYVCIKTDLDREVLAENVRPRYTFDSGKVRYGPIETDASFLYARRSGQTLRYAATHMVRIDFEGRTIFAASPATFGCQPDDLSTGYGPPKWRYWEDTVEVPPGNQR